MNVTPITPTEPACYGAVDCSSGPLGEAGVSVDFGLFWSSGGGFSNRSVSGSGRAWYQKAAVQSYLDEIIRPRLRSLTVEPVHPGLGKSSCDRASAVSRVQDAPGEPVACARRPAG